MEDRKSKEPLGSVTDARCPNAAVNRQFKVFALGKGIDATLIGFAQGDRSVTLWSGHFELVDFTSPQRNGMAAKALRVRITLHIKTRSACGSRGI